MNKNYIGENIRIYRERLKYTQQDLADKIGKTWEMVSRYERGVSSPLNQIDGIAQALNVSTADLLRDSTTEKVNSNSRVPMYTSVPSNLNFQKTKSYTYYSAPDWIINTDQYAFVIDTKLARNETSQIQDSGILYISPNANLELNDIVLQNKDNTLVITTLKSFKEKNSVIGKVLAQEVRF